MYDDNFLTILGSNPTLTLIADSGTDPLFHEAAVWWPPTDEVFFVQNAGAKAAGTGLAKSAIIEKISLSQAAAAAAGGNANATGQVDVVTVPSSPQVINPNGGTNWNGGIVFCGEGQGPDVASALYYMNPVEPYNTTGGYNVSASNAADPALQCFSTTFTDASSTRSTTWRCTLTAGSTSLTWTMVSATVPVFTTPQVWIRFKWR